MKSNLGPCGLWKGERKAQMQCKYEIVKSQVLNT